ncbi:MAG: sigma-70 family RNA polymerase sigma factor [Candidatus Hydrogenedentes bacterium]|nr:sigma-70 family RNA polymerase sigma factor [Candidatus Hydrogenedentota bacterium]
MPEFEPALPQPGATDELIARATAGDRPAFELLVRRTQSLVLRTALHLLGNREDARDATQDVFIRMYNYLPGFNPERPIEPWLYKITLNVCRDMLRKRARWHAGSAAETRPVAVFPRPEARERHELLIRALDTLSERERAAIVLRDFEGVSTEETAQILNIRQVTVRTLISRARIKLKQACDAHVRAEQGDHHDV